VEERLARLGILVAHDRLLAAQRDDWLVREIIGLIRRTLLVPRFQGRYADSAPYLAFAAALAALVAEGLLRRFRLRPAS